MRQRWLLITAMFFIIMTNVVVSQNQMPQLQATAQEEGPAPSPAPDGTARCINDGRRPDTTYPDKAHTNCPCWGNANPNDPKYPKCPAPQGEDPKCANHCKRYMCDCKTKCQS